MRIIVVASLTPPATANYLIAALRELGHDLLVCSDVASPHANQIRRGAFDVSALCRDCGFAAGLLLFVEGGSMQLFPTGLEKLSCLTAWYGIDTHMDFAKHLRIGRLFDVTFIAQKEYVERLQQDGLRQVHWLPLGFAPELLPQPLPPKSLDIAHVGSTHVAANPVRHALLSALMPAFPSHYFGPATPQDMARIYASARLVFNRSVRNDVNMRFFEAAGAGAVLLTDPVEDNGVDELFDEGVHYLVYRDEASLLEAARTLLAAPQRCQAMGQAARQKVLDCHTYRHRALHVLDVVQASAKLAGPSAEDYFSAFLALNLLSAAFAALGQALPATSGGAYRRVSGAVLAAMMQGVSGMLRMIERMRGR